MKRIFVSVVVAAVGFAPPSVLWAQQSKAKPAEKPAAAPAKAPVVNPTATSSAPAASTKEVADADEKAIRSTGEAYVKAFNQHDPKAVADLYTTDAEYVDTRGVLTQGRADIEAMLKTYFTDNPESHLDLSILSVRVIAPNVAIEDGLTTISSTKDSAVVTTRYTAVHSKNTGKWVLASVRDTAIPRDVEHRNRLSQFEWMLGEWVHEGEDATIIFDCYSIANGNYIVRDFSIHLKGRDAITGSQRIGWDAQAGKFKSWIFDSDGSFADGYWHRDDNTWVLKSQGVTAKGQSASSTTLYSFDNAHTMTFQTVDHEVAGVEFADSPPVKIVRRPPRPE